MRRNTNERNEQVRAVMHSTIRKLSPRESVTECDDRSETGMIFVAVPSEKLCLVTTPKASSATRYLSSSAWRDQHGAGNKQGDAN